MHRVVTALGLLVVASLLLIHLDRYPAPWFDEGVHLSAAALLARDGIYGLPDSGGPRHMDTMLQTGVGPPVILPVAAVFRLFGTEILYARLLVVACAILAVGLYWCVGKRLFDRDAALLACVCLMAGSRDPFTSFIYMSRQVLGEVPALAWFLLGLALTLRSLERAKGGKTPSGLVIAAGLAWGASMTTKTQMTLILPASMLVACLADRFYYRQHAWRSLAGSVAVGLACVAAWTLIQLVVLGPEQFALNAAVVREGLLTQTLTIQPTHLRHAAGVFWRTGFLLWGLPGLAWGLWLARDRDEAGFRQLVCLSLPVIALVWFAGFSIGWSRYAFFPFVLAPVWTAHGLLTLLRRRLGPAWCRRAVAVAIAGLAVPLAVSASSWSRNLVWPPPNSFEVMRSYLKAAVPADALIDTWEWEFSLDTRQRLRHPDARATFVATRAIFTDRTTPRGLYDSNQPLPDFVLDGPFSQWTGIYRDLISSRGTRVVAFGAYVLYRIAPSP